MSSVVEATEQALVPTGFKMPEVRVGSHVLWFQYAVINSKRAIAATIVKVNPGTVELRLADGRIVDTVRHKDDPKLNLNEHQREGGAWDFTEEFYAEKHFWAETNRRLERIERELFGELDSLADLDELEAGSETKSDSPASRYHRLRQQCKDEGCEFSGNPPEKELLDMLSTKGIKPVA